MRQSRNKEASVVYVSLGLAILLSVILMASSLYALMGLQQITHKLYQHPFIVNNAALKLENNVQQIRNNMLQIATGVDRPEQNKQAIKEADALAQENLRLIRQNFLGDMSKVDQIESLFAQWQQDRAKVLSAAGRNQRVLAEKQVSTAGLESTERIKALIDYVEDFSGKRAARFMDESNQMLSTELKVLAIITILVMLTFTATGFLTRRFILQFRQLQQAEEEVRQLNADLELRVKERTAELESFSYSVSHDLRVPLRAIDGFSRILLEEYDEKLDDEGKRLLGVVRNNTVRMAQLIDDILAFSRLGRKEMATQDVNMLEMVTAIAADLASTWDGRDVKLEIGSLPIAHCDAAMLRQVWVNLLNNAVKFTRHEPTTVIGVGAYTEGDETVYYVKDNGVGFDMQYAEKLFGVFQRLHGPAEFEGTGIGLAIVKRIITRHGGRVWAQGRLNEGATVYFTLLVKGERS
jgi:signal transduction histidine kinase